MIDNDPYVFEVNYDMPINFAKLAKKCGAKYYGLVTAHAINPTSTSVLMRTKEQAENNAQKLGLARLGIFQPAILTLRDVPHPFWESFWPLNPLVPKINA